MAPRMLDLFCGAGGAGVGYHRAGFEVVGVDIAPQPHYPFEFHQADAIAMVQDRLNGCWHEQYTKSALPGMLNACLGHFDAIHASPPCPRYSAGTPVAYRAEHPDLIGPVRQLLVESGLPWVIENVEGAPLEGPPNLFASTASVTLCGSMFGMEVRRHRLFESPIPMPQPSCRHRDQAVIYSVTGTGYGGKHVGHNGTKPDGIDHARQVMGIDWPMTIGELSNAIPPVYTEWIGRLLIEALVPAAGVTHDLV